MNILNNTTHNLAKKKLVANDWQAIAKAFRTKIVIYSKGKKTYKVDDPAICEPLVLLVTEDFAGILYNRKESRVFAASKI